MDSPRSKCDDIAWSDIVTCTNVVPLQNTAILHGHKSRAGMGKSSPEFGVGDPDANCPPDFVMLQNFKDQIACITFTLQKNVMPNTLEL